MAQTFRPPATQRIYDACVIGSQLGGAVAGALLARRGYRVLHVDHDGVSSAYDDGGYILPYAPALIPSPRLLPAAEMALRELGLTTDTLRALEPCSPDLQILLPRHRVDIPHDAHRRFQELKREWPKDAEPLEAAFGHLAKLFDGATPFLKSMPPLPPAGFAERRAISKAIRFAASAPGAPHASVEEALAFQGLADHPLVSALGIAQRFLGYLEGSPAPLSTTRLLGGVLRGSHKVVGGNQGLRESIRRRIAESRGELLSGASSAIAERLELDGTRVAAVRLAGSPNAWVARVFIAATDSPVMRRLLPRNEAGSSMANLLERIRPRRQLLTVNLVVKAAALPPALGDCVLALRDAKGPDAIENAVLLQVLPARRDKGKGTTETIADERVVCAAGFVPADARDDGHEHLAVLGRQIREAVADAVPFFERHLVRESLPATAAPLEERGSRLLPHPLYEVEGLEQTLGVTGLPCRSPYRNLLFAGREVVPGLGLEGEFHAGLQAANAAQELLGKRELLK